MVVNVILYEKEFIQELNRLDRKTQIRAQKVEMLFRMNPLHPSLRLHGLQGKLEESFSLSVTMKIRIIFKRMPNGDIVFYAIGPHDVYRRRPRM